jgi:hypothetical protein
VHHRQGQAGIDPPAIDNHRAGAALAVVATFLGAGELQVFPQGIEQSGAGVEVQLLRCHRSPGSSRLALIGSARHWRRLPAQK